jgi:AGCS family alanine or glycine:cation symporter
METIENILNQINDVVWGPVMLTFLVGTHVFLTFRTGFIQKYIWKGIKISLSREKEGEGDVSQFGALMTALASTIGTGNIVGVATAISAGGPGAVLWMWLTGVFGIATKYSEALLSMKYRITTPKGEMAGGPMYVLEKGMNSKWLAVFFAFFTAIAAFGIGNMVQANSISTLVHDTFNISPWISGIIMAVITAIVILGGIQAIAKACEKLVPFMAIFYIFGCIVLLIMGWDTLGDTIQLICTSAFSGQAAIGGFLGAGMKEAMRYGVARGLFSNESGMGSAPIVAAAAQSKNPFRQALVSSTGTFWDTVIICALTGVVIVNSGEWLNGFKGAALTKAAFADFKMIGPTILVIGLMTFVFSTILGWSYYGERAAEYLWGTKSIKPYRYFWVVAVMVGSVVKLNTVWTFADISNALMAIPNLISLLILHKVIASETKLYEKDL